MRGNSIQARKRRQSLILLTVLLLMGIFLLKSPQVFTRYMRTYAGEIVKQALSAFSPVLLGDTREEDAKKMDWMIPLLRYGQNTEKEKDRIDQGDPSYQEYQKLVRLYDELSNEYSMEEGTNEHTEEKVAENGESGGEDGTESIHQEVMENTKEKWETEDLQEEEVETIQENEIQNSTVLELPYSMEQLADYDFLIQKVYNVHSSTTAPREVMNAEKFLEKEFSLEKKGEPEILIYHTHSQETYLPQGAGEDGASVVALGNVLTQKLEEKGYHVVHDTSVYDLKNGKLDRNKAYTYALEGVQQILGKYPSIEVVIDLHRDGVAENVHLVSEINGKPTAQLMFFNGMSQTPEGAIAYLENPYREENLAFSFQLQMQAMKYYPGLTRKIFLKGLRYNLHVRPRSLLIEAGAQNNTFEEAYNAMEPLADILDRILG